MNEPYKTAEEFINDQLKFYNQLLKNKRDRQECCCKIWGWLDCMMCNDLISIKDYTYYANKMLDLMYYKGELK